MVIPILRYLVMKFAPLSAAAPPRRIIGTLSQTRTVMLALGMEVIAA
jgi:hypothetical protein